MNWKFDFSPETSAEEMSVSFCSSAMMLGFYFVGADFIYTYT